MLPIVVPATPHANQAIVVRFTTDRALPRGAAYSVRIATPPATGCAAVAIEGVPGARARGAHVRVTFRARTALVGRGSARWCTGLASAAITVVRGATGRLLGQRSFTILP